MQVSVSCNGVNFLNEVNPH